MGVADPAVGNLTLSGGKSDNGAAVANKGTLTVSASTVSGNASSAALLNYATGSVTVTASTFSGNVAGGSQNGGGIRNLGTLAVSSSTVSGNSSYAGGGLDNAGTATVSNSTFSGNTATSIGGGINTGGGSLTVSNSTLAGNTSTFGIGGGLGVSAGSVTLSNSVVALSPSGSDLYLGGGTLSGSYNLVQDGLNLGGLTNTVTGNPLLGALADNGGPTQTRLPQPGSPLVGAGSNALVLNGVSVDQVGNTRLVGTVDIGSVEIQDTTPATVSSTRLAASAGLDPSKAYNLNGGGRTTNLGLSVAAIDVVFDEPVTATPATLLGLPSGITVASVQGSGTSRLRFVLSAPIQSGSVTLTLAQTGASGVRDLAGNLGLNAAYSQTFSVKYGDYDGSESVTSADLTAVRAAFTAATGVYDPLADFNGDGTVDNADYLIVRGRIGR